MLRHVPDLDLEVCNPKGQAPRHLIPWVGGGAHIVSLLQVYEENGGKLPNSDDDSEEEDEEEEEEECD